jgi:hypothetical protein
MTTTDTSQMETVLTREVAQCFCCKPGRHYGSESYTSSYDTQYSGDTTTSGGGIPGAPAHQDGQSVVCRGVLERRL